jgi:NAD(P)-dependent dehydrogenase (short-subunit alcohol dehydrogenase family)
VDDQKNGKRPSAIVTAASQGIGAACARGLAERGYSLTIMARSDLIHEVARETGAIAIQGDVTKPEDLERLTETALKAHGQIDAVVANTGLSRDIGSYTGKHFDKDNNDSVTTYDDHYWTDMFDLQYMLVVRLARLLTPQMQKQGHGAFVNISAMISKEPHAAYASSSIIRRALDGYTKLYADRHARDGIRMNTVSPGLVANRDWTQDQLDAVPMQRAVDPQELATIVAFLLSDDSAYINGQNILADGGFNRSI